MGEGCINNVDGKTKGILDEIDPMHTRNYGACMCAKREDVIGVGGADEDLTYLGHICGPYDMTFRLMNFGKRLAWEANRYLYHMASRIRRRRQLSWTTRWPQHVHHGVSGFVLGPHSAVG